MHYKIFKDYNTKCFFIEIDKKWYISIKKQVEKIESVLFFKGIKLGVTESNFNKPSLINQETFDVIKECFLIIPIKWKEIE